MLSKYELICHPLFLIVSGAFNVPPVVLGILGVVEWCTFFSNWLLWNVVLAALNMVMSIYCVYKIRRATRISPGETVDDHGQSNAGDGIEEEIETPTITMNKGDDASETDSNSNTNNDLPNITPVSQKKGCFSRLVHYRTPANDRIRYLICYDGITTTYSIVFLVWIFWLSEGLQRITQADAARIQDEEDFDGCFTLHDRYMMTSLVCGFAFFGFVIAAGTASICNPDRSS